MSTAARVRWVARAAQRRIIFRTLLYRFARWLPAAGGAAVVLALVDRFSGLSLPPWGSIGLPLAAILGWAVSGVVKARPSELAGAAAIDSALALEDRVSTGLALHSAADDPFARMAIDEAEMVATNIDPAKSLPIRWRRQWAAGPLLIAAALGLVLFVPRWSPEASNFARQVAVRAEQARAGAEQLDEALVEARGAIPTSDLPEVSQEQIASLQQLEQELERTAARPTGAQSAERSPRDALADGARVLEEMAREQRSAAEEGQRAFDQIAQSLGEAPRELGPPHALADALRRGDFDRARFEAEKLADAPERTPGDRINPAQAARELSRMADHLEESIKQTDEPINESSESEGANSESSSTQTSPSGSKRDPNPPATAQRMKDLVNSLREAARDLQQDQQTPEAPPRSTSPKSEQPERDADRSTQSNERARRSTSDSKPSPNSDSAGRSALDRPESAAAKTTSGSERPSTDQTPSATPGTTTPTSDSHSKSPKRDPASSDSRSEKPESGKNQAPGANPGRDSDRSNNDAPGSSPAAAQTQPAEGSGGDARRGDKQDAVGAPGQKGTRSPGDQAEPSNAPAAGQWTDTRKRKSAGADASNNAVRPEPSSAPQPSPGSEPAIPSGQASEQTGGIADSKSPSKASAQPRHVPGEDTPAGAKVDKPGVKPSQGRTQPDKPSGDAKASPSSTQEGQREGTVDHRRQSESSSGERTDAKSSKPGSAVPDARSNDQRDETQAPSTNGQRPGLKQLAEQLSNISRDRDRARRQRQAAERLSQQAQKLYENASPEQRAEMEQWAERAARDLRADQGPHRGIGAGAGPDSGRGNAAPPVGSTQEQSAAQFETIGVPDRSRLKEDGPPPVVVAEWLGDGAKSTGSNDAARLTTAREQVGQAVKTAEEAIGERTLPRRYDRVLGEYFRRLPKRFGSSTDGPPPAAPAARDGDAPTP